jgi:hypothetical protein
MRPHPLFREFVAAAVTHLHQKQERAAALKE